MVQDDLNRFIVVFHIAKSIFDGYHTSLLGGDEIFTHGRIAVYVDGRILELYVRPRFQSKPCVLWKVVVISYQIGYGPSFGRPKFGVRSLGRFKKDRPALICV
jgi:hypothetical protein